MDFLKSYSNDALGPIQYDEAVFLYGLALTIAPKKVLEFGSLLGHSTRVWLEAGCEVTAVDVKISHEVAALQRKFPGMLELVQMPMEEYLPNFKDRFDLVFWDAGHHFATSVQTFENNLLNFADAMHVVHDTGVWHYDVAPQHVQNNWPNSFKRYHTHQPDEVRFVLYLIGRGFHCIDFNTTRKFRHGLSVLKRGNQSLGFI